MCLRPIHDAERQPSHSHFWAVMPVQTLEFRSTFPLLRCPPILSAGPLAPPFAVCGDAVHSVAAQLSSCTPLPAAARPGRWSSRRRNNSGGGRQIWHLILEHPPALSGPLSAQLTSTSSRPLTSHPGPAAPPTLRAVSQLPSCSFSHPIVAYHHCTNHAHCSRFQYQLTTPEKR